jgi:alkylation response protein AidB-like acyl-CoA dehydrogenase
MGRQPDRALSAHQSIGVPQPLKLFGTPEQKKKYLPRPARGRLRLRADGSGRDRTCELATTAARTPGDYILNGEKLCAPARSRSFSS